MLVGRMVMLSTLSVAVGTCPEHVFTFRTPADSFLIETPNYPQNYANNLECSWLLTVDRRSLQAYFVEFSVVDFQTEPNKDVLFIQLRDRAEISPNYAKTRTLKWTGLLNGNWSQEFGAAFELQLKFASDAQVHMYIESEVSVKLSDFLAFKKIKSK